MTMITGLVDIFKLIEHEEVETVQGLFVTTPEIDDHLLGLFQGNWDVRQFIKKKSAWLKDNVEAISVINKVDAPNCQAVEFSFDLKKDGNDLPVAVIADTIGKKMTQLRIYHSTWPLTGEHKVRIPQINPRNDLEEPEYVRNYMKGLGEGNVELVLAQFSDNGYFQEPSGRRFRYMGMEKLTELYTSFLGHGGIILEHCNALFDGKTAGIEFIAKEWAGKAMPPQAGAAFYQVDDEGKIIAARVYDDVNPPL